MATDTTPDARAIQRAAWMSKSGSERVAMAVEMYVIARSIVISGIRSRHPGIADSELALEVIARMHGRELAAEVERARVDGA